MKARHIKKETITGPVLKDLIARDKANQKFNRDEVTIGEKPLDPPALYEDSGEGYNADFTFPQD